MIVMILQCHKSGIYVLQCRPAVSIPIKYCGEALRKVAVEVGVLRVSFLY